ncbi:LacI family transcriptional regulator [Microbacterium sp. P26]|uniref:LacI family DNA-binding transcriptional regulator n=1 Tax=Microbacterium TaxID=33882 RepID=UPI00203BC2A0|nr:LacI family DNA-binding transcriptional regulator [Microbacterium sp. P26]MCM3502602.1 LacI family transcriptional regulator [Microbacterium sp. P26]
MTTLADVAALAGVAKSTASRALGRPDLVAPETVARVRAAAVELGFVPNRAASHLARGNSGIVALVVPTLDNAFFTPIIAGAQVRARASDLQLTVAVHPLDDADDVVDLGRLMRQVDGCILVAPRASDEVVHEVAAFGPTVLVDREVAGLTSLVADTARAFADLSERFVASGHRAIAYLGGPVGSWQDAQRSAAIADAVGDRATLTRLGPFPATFAAGVGAADSVIASNATAVVPYATSLGLGLVFALRARGISSPGEIVVSAERLVAEAIGADEVPAIDVDGDELGREAMSALVDMLASGLDTGARRRLDVAVHWPETTPVV